MLTYNLTFTDRFKKHFKDLHPNEQKQTMKKLALLAENPYHPSLRAKKIQGAYDRFECSVNMDIRILWHFEGNQIIIVLDIGHHDILKQF